MLARGQSAEIPGRDLLTFPLGLTAEAAAIGQQSGTGFWNPATAVLSRDSRWRLSASAMNTSQDIGISAQIFSVAALWRETTLGISVARASVADLLRTDADPLSIGNEILYATTVISGVAVRRLAPNVVAGVSVRTRSGQLDNITLTGTSVDVGVLAEHLTRYDVRLGASTFLLSLFGKERERASYLAGADARVAGSDSLLAVRAGYGLVATPGASAEHYVFVSGRWRRWEARGGPVKTDIYGSSNLRLRLGVALHNAGYALGFSREESANGLSPTYHFSISTVLK